MKRTLLFIACALASLTMSAQKYFPEGTKWTEIRLDTLKNNSWYTSFNGGWVPHFETIEYYVKGEFIDKFHGDGKDKYKCVYTNGPEWTDSLTLLIQEEGDAEYVGHNNVMVSVLNHDLEGSSSVLWPGMAYQFDWSIGKGIYYEDILMSNTTSTYPFRHFYGIIEEMKEGDFGGVRPLKYVDLDGKAPIDSQEPGNRDTNGGRIIQGIGITEWNDGECLFGPPNPYNALRMLDYDRGNMYPERHYRSMLVHFERNGEVLYDVCPDLPCEDYFPFVGLDKQWQVVRSVPGQDNIEKVTYNLRWDALLGDAEKVNLNGKDYYKMKVEFSPRADVLTYLLREEDRKVYIFDTDTQKEHLMFDFSLKEGDTYETYSYEYQKMVKYEVLSVDDYTEGPKFIRYDLDLKTGNLIAHRRYLRKWVVVSDIEKELCLEPKTWIEGIGSVEGPFANLYDTSYSLNHLAYVTYVGDFLCYLPFSFRESSSGMWYYGCNLPTGEKSNKEGERERHYLTYELEGDRLHVYGDVFTQCRSNNYAYFYDKPTDNPLVHKIKFEIQEVMPLKDCVALQATDFYVPGFDPNLNYIVVENNGEEHPVINKTAQMAYRPFIEEGKVWKAGASNSGNPVQIIGYYYFDGDTIIDGKTCKQMMRQQYISHDFPYYDLISPQDNSLSYVGAWYEEEKKVYEYDTTSKKFKLMYDFSIEANDTLEIDNQLYVIGLRQTGGIKGFKGVYRDVLMCKDGGNIVQSTPWLEGVGGIYGPTTNVIDSELADPAWFLMSCTVGDEVIYFNDDYEDGATPAEARKRFDFTHTIKTQPKAPIKGEKSDVNISSSEREVARPEVKAPKRSEAMQTLYGEYNNQQLGINLDPLDDAYMVRITDESGKTVYEKAINAGNIVGLNIDISDYAAGRYTVTVENRSESFTGVFEVQTTGISHTPALSQSEGIIFDLQGRRLQGKPERGVYIQNGRKYVLK